jgi:hypothetical protein
MTRLFIVALLAAVTQFSCTEKTVDLVTYESPMLNFGIGGGMTGLKNEYILLTDGRIFKRDAITDSLSFVCRATKKDVNAAFTDFGNLSSHEINAPGEMYYYVTRKSDEGEMNLVWGDPGYQTPLEVKEYWTRINSLIKTR